MERPNKCHHCGSYDDLRYIKSHKILYCLYCGKTIWNDGELKIHSDSLYEYPKQKEVKYEESYQYVLDNLNADKDQ